MANETQNKVLSLVADIVKTHGKSSDAVASNFDVENAAPKKYKLKSTQPAIKGKPKSGRFWKTEKER